MMANAIGMTSTSTITEIQLFPLPFSEAGFETNTWPVCVQNKINVKSHAPQNNKKIKDLPCKY